MSIENIQVFLCVLRDLCVRIIFYGYVNLDGPVKSQNRPFYVIPAKVRHGGSFQMLPDSLFHGSDRLFDYSGVFRSANRCGCFQQLNKKRFSGVWNDRLIRVRQYNIKNNRF